MEETAIISLYSINWRCFITETESVYCIARVVRLCMTLNTVGLFTIKFWNIIRHVISEKKKKNINSPFYYILSLSESKQLKVKFPYSCIKI